MRSTARSLPLPGRPLYERLAEHYRRAIGAGSLMPGDRMPSVRAVMERQLAQLVRLVDDLLDVSRITRGKIELRKERVELAAVVASAVETSRPLIEAAGHELTVTLPPEPINLDADLTRLAQVFSNLLNNAAKYTEQGGHIWLTAERHGGEVVVKVRDTGLGIPADMLPKIFEMFTQVDPSLERSQSSQLANSTTLPSIFTPLTTIGIPALTS